MSEIFEITMIFLFGVSWPFNVVKSWRAKTAKGKSVVFLLCILIGYFAGIISKFLNSAYMSEIGEKWYVLFFYFLNFIMVFIDFILYFRNKSLDRKSQSKNSKN